ncbi:indole-3-glycerol phosphate synthase TrpC [Candidatus Kaiserbacteria bacterium]|nr:indole-3-glycerol phosphate synthase TrpC [Candidatus Kaiserbacteria bacterium]
MSILDEIVATKRAEIEALAKETTIDEMRSAALSHARQRTTRPFLSLFEKPVLIAEIKPRSPSAGALIQSDPLALTESYAKSSADVISVLTDQKYFGGNLQLLKDVRGKVPQTILRKDFLVDPYQIYETTLSGADTYLLIAAALGTEALAHLIAFGASLGMDALVEVHDEKDLHKALEAGAKILGINNRDLKTFNVDLQTTETLMKKVPSSIPVVSESGIETADDVKRVRAAGVRGILVGTSILRSGDPLAKINELKAALA